MGGVPGRYHISRIDLLEDVEEHWGTDRHKDGAEVPAVPERPLTDFEHVLLGWIVAGPQSAYDLKKLFAATPASVYQPSPGALVPALRRLERRGLVSVETDGTPGRRLRRLYRPTETGRLRHRAWLHQGVDPATVGRDLGLHLVRFVMMERDLPLTDVLGFLAELADALERFVGSIEKYMASTSLPGRHPLLALGHGVSVHRASLDWVRSTMTALAAAQGAAAQGAAAPTIGAANRTPPSEPHIDVAPKPNTLPAVVTIE